jgi:hypothetical protein
MPFRLGNGGEPYGGRNTGVRGNRPGKSPPRTARHRIALARRNKHLLRNYERCRALRQSGFRLPVAGFTTTGAL